MDWDRALSCIFATALVAACSGSATSPAENAVGGSTSANNGLGGAGTGGGGSATTGGASSIGGASSTAPVATGGAASAVCTPKAYCLDGSGNSVAGCESPCGGIGLVVCPSSDLVCVSSRPSMWNDGALNYCIPRLRAQCTTAADCVCLPGDCSQWGGSTSAFRWNCTNGICGVSCM